MPACVIGITGGIGSGKSVVSRILRLWGYEVFDCDCEAKLLMVEDEVVVDSVKYICGNEAYDESGNLNKAFVAKRIFSDEEALRSVNGIVHKRVRELFCQRADASGGVMFCESAILFTSGLADLCHELWIVEAPENIRIERVMKRSGLSERQIHERMSAQRKELCNISGRVAKFIVNDGSRLLLPTLKSHIEEIDKLNQDNRKTICLEKF